MGSAAAVQLFVRSAFGGVAVRLLRVFEICGQTVQFEAVRTIHRHVGRAVEHCQDQPEQDHGRPEVDRPGKIKNAANTGVNGIMPRAGESALIRTARSHRGVLGGNAVVFMYQPSRRIRPQSTTCEVGICVPPAGFEPATFRLGGGRSIP